MAFVISILMVALIASIGVRGYRKGNEEALRHLQETVKKNKTSPEALALMRGAGYNV